MKREGNREGGRKREGEGKEGGVREDYSKRWTGRQKVIIIDSKVRNRILSFQNERREREGEDRGRKREGEGTEGSMREACSKRWTGRQKVIINDSKVRNRLLSF